MHLLLISIFETIYYFVIRGFFSGLLKIEIFKSTLRQEYETEKDSTITQIQNKEVFIFYQFLCFVKPGDFDCICLKT